MMGQAPVCLELLPVGLVCIVICVVEGVLLLQGGNGISSVFLSYILNLCMYEPQFSGLFRSHLLIPHSFLVSQPGMLLEALSEHSSSVDQVIKLPSSSETNKAIY